MRKFIADNVCELTESMVEWFSERLNVGMIFEKCIVQCSGVAQLVEHRLDTAKVRSSSLLTTTQR